MYISSDKKVSSDHVENYVNTVRVDIIHFVLYSNFYPKKLSINLS